MSGEATGPGSDLRCSLCGAGVPREAARACGLCAAPHHEDCWEYTGMCSAYGCGGIAAVPWRADLVPVEVAIDGRRAHGLALRTMTSSLLRKGRERARDLPATMLAGGLGAAAATGALILAWPMLRGTWILLRPGFWNNFVAPYAFTYAACGLGYGFLSPFLAPLQHRRPVTVAVVSGAAAFAVYLGAPQVTWAVVGVAALLGVLAAATVGERILGPHRPLGRRLGWLGTAGRYLFVGVFFFLAATGAALARGFHPTPTLLTECALWGLLAALGGGHALEVGKEEYRKHLIALVEGPADDQTSTVSQSSQEGTTS